MREEKRNARDVGCITARNAGDDDWKQKNKKKNKWDIDEENRTFTRMPENPVKQS